MSSTVTEPIVELAPAAREAIERAHAKLDTGRLADLVFDMTAVPSPTG